MSEREEFEKWAENNSFSVKQFKKTSGENSNIYADADTHCAWLGFQAARNDAFILRKKAQAVGESIRQIEDINSKLALVYYIDKLQKQAHELENKQ